MVPLKQKHDRLNRCPCPDSTPVCTSMCNIHMTGICTMQNLVTGNENIRHSQQFTGRTINLDPNVRIQGKLWNTELHFRSIREINLSHILHLSKSPFTTSFLSSMQHSAVTSTNCESLKYATNFTSSRWFSPKFFKTKGNWLRNESYW